MKIQQRTPIELGDTAAQSLWDPGLVEIPDAPPLNLPPPAETDWYVSVDERVGNTIGIVAVAWPTTDERGLHFGDDMFTSWHQADQLQSAIDDFRAENGQVQRPIRIGDTFWIRSNAPEDDGWADLRDVTPHARRMAKGAVANAAVGAVTVEDAEQLLRDYEEVGGVRVKVVESDAAPEPPSAAATAIPTV